MCRLWPRSLSRDDGQRSRSLTNRSFFMPHHNYLSRFRKQFALAQHELADLLATSESTVSRIEDGTTPPSLAFALGCAVLFKMPPAEFLPGIATAVKQA